MDTTDPKIKRIYSRPNKWKYVYIVIAVRLIYHKVREFIKGQTM